MQSRLSFTTDIFAEHDRFSAFCEEVAKRYTGLDLRTRYPGQFNATVDLQRVGAIDVGFNRTSAVDSERSTSRLRDGDDSILITFLKYGMAFRTQHEDHQEIGPGDVVINDCGCPGKLNFLTDAQFLNVRIPRRKLAALLPPAFRFAGTRLDRTSPVCRLLSGYLEHAFEVDLQQDSRTSQLCGDHVVDLVALALGAGGDAYEAIERRSARAVRRAAILSEINLSIADPHLNAGTVAARLGVTPRYVRMLLEETGKSFSEHVLERRLEHAAILLRDRTQHHRRIADIAFTCGFGDLSYFNRAFRCRFDRTPSDIRESAKHEDS